MQTIDYSKISITAKLVAYYRQFSDIPFAQDVASYIDAEEGLKEIASKLESDGEPAGNQKAMADEAKIYAPLLEARYKCIVQFIEKTQINQVLELASGFSLRGLAMSENADISYVESDLPELNEEKRKLIGALREKHGLSDRGNHSMVTANALERADLEAATASLNYNQPLVVVHEGLLPYLSEQERSIVAGNVRYLLSKFAGGAWITPDFATRKAADDVSEHRKRFRQAISGATDRQLHAAAFASEEAIDGFISDHGFAGTSVYQSDVVTDLVSLKRLELSNVVLERLRPYMRIWLMFPK